MADFRMRLDNEKDADVIEALNAAHNKTEFVKDAIRQKSMFEKVMSELRAIKRLLQKGRPSRREESARSDNAR